MKHSVIIIAFFVVTVIAGEYRNLSKSERKEFERSHKAIVTAFNENNDEPVLRFGPEIISRYESIMLDPECRKLRPRYNDLAVLLKTVKYRVEVDSIRREMRQLLDCRNIESALIVSDRLLNRLSEDDSTRSESKNRFDSLVRIVKANNSMHAYSFLATLRNVDRQELKELRVSMHEAFDERIAQLSASLDGESIMKFRKEYPGVRADDLDALLDRSRVAERQSLIRNPSLQRYAKYRELFGDDEKLKKALRRQAFTMAFSMAADPGPLKEYIRVFPSEEQEIWTTFEDLLYKDWNAKQTRTAAASYLRLFPNGRYASMISSVLPGSPAVGEYVE